MRQVEYAEGAKLVEQIVRYAGGKVVGRTRLQKIAYLLDVTGYGVGFKFRYRHFGPYSDEAAEAARSAVLLGNLNERVEDATWGGTYSIYEVREQPQTNVQENPPYALARKAADASAIELELVATAVFLSREGHDNPWGEAERRKPQKADGRIGNARKLLVKLKQIGTEEPLPNIP